MIGRPKGEAWPWAAVLAAFSVVPLYAAIHAGVYLNDDAYITLTYARNLVQGNGFVYNAPPASLGTTTPLFTLLAALGGVIFGAAQLPAVAVWLSVICWIGAAWLLFLCRSAFGLSPALATLIGAFLLTARYPYLGSEATLFLLLLIAAMAAGLSRRWALSGLLVGFLFLARGEGVLLLPLLVVARFLLGTTSPETPTINDEPAASHRALIPFVRDCFWMGLAALAPVVLWSVYAWTQFGRILPQTLAAKMIQGRQTGAVLFPEGLWHAMTREWAFELAPFGFPLRYVLWFLAFLGLWACLRHHRPLLLWGGWVALYVAAYSALQVPAYAWWYRIPVSWFWFVLIALGAGWLLKQLATEGAGRWARAGRVFVGIAIALILVMRAALEIMLAPQFGDHRGPLFLETATWIHENTEEDEAIATVEVGYLGFYTPNPIVDLAALVSPEYLPYIAEGRAHDIIMHARPPYYLKLDWTGDPMGAGDLRVLGSGEYRLVKRFRHADAPGPAILYRRNPAP